MWSVVSVERECTMVGLPVGGIGSLFYLVLSLAMGVTELWRWAQRVIRRSAARSAAKPVARYDRRSTRPRRS